METLLNISRQEICKFILLLHIFVLSAAAQCLRPEIGQNVILTDDTLLKNDFPEGSEAGLECGNGYRKQSGSGTMTCNNGKWTEPDIICKKKDCGALRAEPHMVFDISEGTLFGAKVRTTCEEGYRLSGSSFRQCYNNGWFGKGSCNIVTCPTPNEVENGRSSWNSDKSPEYGQVINFTCNMGYILSGSEIIMCTKTGTYDSLPPNCVGVTTEDSITTKIITSSAATKEQVLTSTISTTLTTLESSTQEEGHRSLLPERKAGTTIVPLSTSSFYKGQNIQTKNVNTEKGYAPVIISVIVVTIVVLILIFILKKFLERRKGSYDTGEDLKPELLHFQTL